eukprot:TRINITY_DN3747_c0_g1_i12.p1 TRINITY_DN3747_c0_g1~~TRINITY_DN3747_c0_g1_i12.p1  ORF type:complete len:135 (+),score=18.08 TRINITY_DN3747_c0_g1_i12:941-1345(+)
MVTPLLLSSFNLDPTQACSWYNIIPKVGATVDSNPVTIHVLILQLSKLTNLYPVFLVQQVDNSGFKLLGVEVVGGGDLNGLDNSLTANVVNLDLCRERKREREISLSSVSAHLTIAISLSLSLPLGVVLSTTHY